MERHIKSFVLRKGRMTEGQKNAFIQLSGKYCLNPENRTDFSDCFNESADLYAEIGFGMGDATWQIALKHPQNNYLGIEVFPPGVGKLLSRIAENSIENIRIIQDDAVKILNKNTKDNIFSGIHVFFPDPWPKKRHNKRRLLQPAFISLCADKLKEGGYLYVVSDWQDYAEEILENLSKEPKLFNKYSSYALPQPWRPGTKFEQKGKNKNHTIYEMFFIRS